MIFSLDLVTVPVSDVDRAKAFYVERAGFGVAQDHQVDESHRFVELVPPGSPCSIALTTSYVDAEPGSLQGIQLDVEDADPAHALLRDRGVEVTDVQAFPWGRFCFFTDPDGNGWSVHGPPRPSGQQASGAYTRLGEVDTWWDVHGDGAPLVLLHPGGADSRAWDHNLRGLVETFRCYRFDRRGQGRTPDVGGPITFDAMTDDAIAFLETVVGGPAHLAGHSIGAPVGLLVAGRRPDLVRGLVFSEGVFHHDGWLPGVLDPLAPDVHDFLGGLYAEVSPHGAEHWPSVWQRLDAEHHRAPALTTDDLAAIATPSLLMFADDGTEVDPEHVHAMHRALPDAQLAIVPGTGHGLPAEKPGLCNLLITDFLTQATTRDGGAS